MSKRLGPHGAVEPDNLEDTGPDVEAEESGTALGTEQQSTRHDLAQLGARIRQLRVERELTLAQLAGQTGLSISMLSAVERGRANPSIGSLVSIASALGVSMVDLFADDENGALRLVVRHEEQPIITTAEGFRRRLLVRDRLRGLEMALNEYEAGAASNPTPIRHQGYEFGVVLSGRLVVEMENQAHELREGDSAAYPSSVPHRTRNPGPGRARTIWVNLYGER